MKLSKTLYRLLVILFSAMLIVSSTFVIRYTVDAVKQKREYNELAALVEQARSETAPHTEPAADDLVPATEGTAPSEPAVPTEPVMLPDYAALYEKNPDTVGWITIEGTPINYPVMQTPDREDYYLKRNFNGQSSAHGCIYVRETCDVFTPSDNVTIYGHHMKDGSMFAGLDNFLSQSFREDHRTICFDTLYERHTYTVFAVFTTTASVGQGFAYHRFENARDAADFDDFVESCKKLSVFDSGITPQYGDKLICLSTCEYTRTNGRLVVVAVRDEANQDSQ